jgi:hypothetical protein
MKCLVKLFIPVAAIALLFLAAPLSAQTLADAARAQQKNKKPKAEKVYTNDSLDFRPASDSNTKAGDDKKTDAKADAKSDKPGDDSSAEDDKKKAAAALKEKYDKQKNELAQL